MPITNQNAAVNVIFILTFFKMAGEVGLEPTMVS